jgi:hypothetical protein
MMRHTREHRAVVVAGALETLTKKYNSSNEFQHCTSSSKLAKREIVQIDARVRHLKAIDANHVTNEGNNTV